jgi:hypothetical protein
VGGGGGGGGGRKKKWKRKAMSEDEGRSDQSGLALVLSERLEAKPKPERSETPHTRPYPYTAMSAAPARPNGFN